MALPSTIRNVLPLIIGLAVGGLGATLFLQSMPPEEGSPEEQVRKLEVDLQRAENRVRALEAADPDGRRRPGRSFADGTRGIFENIREGRPVSPDDVFRATQPLLRDLAPLFDRVRVRQQQDMIDRMTGELARKHQLSPTQQAALQQWFERKAEDEAKRWSDLVARDGTTLEDLMRATHDVRPDDGLDAFMETQLSGDKLAAFRSERLAERAERVQRTADMNVQRLDHIVGLDDVQRDQVFGIMARGSRDYDPSMTLEGIGGEIGATPGGSRQDAMLSVLRPDQLAAYEAEQARRFEEAAKDAAAIGLTLPPEWQAFDEFAFD